jgi:ubiquinone biosynthesis protein UbiJ
MVHTHKQKQQKMAQDLTRFMERFEQQMKCFEQQLKDMVEVLSALHMKYNRLSTRVQRRLC